MKKRIRFLTLALSLLIMLGSFSVSSVFADYSSTETYYMNGYAMRGQLLTYSDSADASTFCENLGYGKKVSIVFHCKLEDQDVYLTRGVNSYVVNGFDTFSYSADKPNNVDKVRGAESKHWVKASTHMYWSSDDCEDNCYGAIEYPFFDGT